ncbi:SMP-30/gluconolactonase/LRE family protein [Lignipirellula cremea]|uniref:Gluconolactonase n=1 Tax=Lignipirellula cremea TaxID=2528010 RepID=A0A518DPB0_9BACT|nr:SMP-30/gluconolactonase/LRE family protein [Lignipirellula cremea]QDU93679.1 Gluconolactonase precursor [Lignipirellula cremea]
MRFCGWGKASLLAMVAGYGLTGLLPGAATASEPKAAHRAGSTYTLPVPADAQVQIEGSVAFTEGPAWHPDGQVYFTDITNNRIVRRDADLELRTFRQPSGRANGLAFDLEGRLLACEGGGEGGNRRVTRTAANGVISVLTDRFEGKRYNSPNDLTVDSLGRIYFTDPRYGDRTDIELKDASGQPIEGVYRIDPDGKVVRVITHEVDRPNGIAVSADSRYLFVADNVNSGQGYDAVDHRCLWRFELDKRGDIVADSRQLLFDWGTDRGPDGICLDSAGRIYAAAGFNVPSPPRETSKTYKAGVYVISPNGGLVDFIPVLEDMATNCTFGGDDLKTLFITAGHKLWSIRLDTPGYLPWLAKRDR